MSELDARIAATLAEANGSTSEGAKDQSGTGNGTPEESATVHQDSNGSNSAPPDSESGEGGDGEGGDNSADELLYSEATYQSARETALQEGRDTALQERITTENAIRARLLDAVKAEGADGPKVLRAVSEAVKNLAPGLTDSDIDPVMKVARDAMSVIESAAFAVVGEGYAGAINEMLGSEAEVKSFWENATTLDPTLDFAGVINALIDQRALASKAVRDADPEALIKASPKLKAHIDKFGDDKFKAGRDRGQRDQRPNPSSEGRASNGSSGGRARDDNGNIDVDAELAKITGG